MAWKARRHWRRRTSSVSPASRSSKTSPTQTIGIRPASKAVFSFKFTVSSVSPKYWRRSECPMITWVQPTASNMPAEISPVYAPSFSQCRFWPPIAILDPFVASTAAGRETKEGQTVISSRVCSAIKGAKLRKKSRVWSDVLYIFQFAAISFLRMIPFTNGYEERLALGSKSFYARQLLAFQKFEGCATAGRDVCDLVDHAGCVYSGNCVTAAYDRSRARIVGDRLG